MKSRESELIYIFLFFDLAVLNVAILLTSWLSRNISLYNYHTMSVYLLHGNLSWVLTYFIFAKKNLYLRDGFINRVWRITKRTLIFMTVSAVLTFLLMPKWYSRFFFVGYTTVFYIAQLVAYYILYSYLKYKRKKGLNTNRVLIAGYNETGRVLRKLIDSNPLLGYKFMGYISPDPSDDIEVIGTPDELAELIEIHQIQMVFVSLSLFSEQNDGKYYMKVCNPLGVRLHFIPENQRWFRSRVNMESVGNIVVINPQEIPLDDAGKRVSKRLFDIAFSSIIIIGFLSWMVPLIAILIKLSSKGPVFFVQKRTGINNKIFNCYKFRSMQVNGQADTQQATANDSRITWLGRILRRTNLDELPQFFNVFWGQMSVVGPRPHMLKHTDQYSELIKYYLIRHYVKPGITGWAQVNGYRGETNELWKMEKRVEYDMEYIENWTFFWDLKIIFLTIFGKNALKNAG